MNNSLGTEITMEKLQNAKVLIAKCVTDNVNRMSYMKAIDEAIGYIISLQTLCKNMGVDLPEGTKKDEQSKAK